VRRATTSRVESLAGRLHVPGGMSRRRRVARSHTSTVEGYTLSGDALGTIPCDIEPVDALRLCRVSPGLPASDAPIFLWRRSLCARKRPDQRATDNERRLPRPMKRRFLRCPPFLRFSVAMPFPPPPPLPTWPRPPSASRSSPSRRPPIALPCRSATGPRPAPRRRSSPARSGPAGRSATGSCHRRALRRRE
jgi:hypothetical protein